MRTTRDHDPSQWNDHWRNAYQILEESIVPSKLRAWIQPLVWLTAEEDESMLQIRLAAPNEFSAQWVKDNYLELIEKALNQVTGVPCKVALEAKERSPAEIAPSSDFQHEETAPRSGHSMSDQRPRAAFSGNSTGLVPVDPRYLFDSFVVGASNQIAYASAVAVSERPGGQYNPLFIYSSPGLGKTHLLHAIGNHFISNNPGARVGYISAESFVNELVESLQRKRMPEFRAKYRNSFDILLVDDIQFIAGKETTEEEFFHTFNALYGSKRQIVLSCDRPPKDIERLQERIRTRFEWGLVAYIQPPEIETRIAILKAKAERDDIYLPDDVATFLATHVKNNVRQLEGTLIRLQAQASLTGAEISLDMAKQEIQNSLIPDEESQMTVESIQSTVAQHFHLKVQDLKSSTRTKSVAVPRQIAMYLIRKYKQLRFKEIGRHFGGKDHTTILHACSKIEKSLESDSDIRTAVEAIQNKL